MKKIIALVLVMLLAVSCLTACAGGAKDSKTITVATSPDFPPFESLEGGEVVGIEVDIIDLVAKELGLTVKLEQMDFDSVLPGVQAGKFDVGMSGITVTEEREKNAAFTMPYFMASQAIVVMADSDITGKADLEGKTISVQTGTTAESYCMENGYEVLSFQANNDACMALTSGKVDAWVVDNEVAVALSAEQNGATVVLDEAMTQEPYAFMFAKDNTELAASFDEVLEKLIADGTVESIFTKYGVPYVGP